VLRGSSQDIFGNVAMIVIAIACETLGRTLVPFQYGPSLCSLQLWSRVNLADWKWITGCKCFDLQYIHILVCAHVPGIWQCMHRTSGTSTTSTTCTSIRSTSSTCPRMLSNVTYVTPTCIYTYIPLAPQTYIFRVLFDGEKLGFRWPKPLFFMVLGAHGVYYIYK